jgi:hypothetical protein
VVFLRCRDVSEGLSAVGGFPGVFGGVFFMGVLPVDRVAPVFAPPVFGVPVFFGAGLFSGEVVFSVAVDRLDVFFCEIIFFGADFVAVDWLDLLRLCVLGAVCFVLGADFRAVVFGAVVVFRGVCRGRVSLVGLGASVFPGGLSTSQGVVKLVTWSPAFRS